MCDIERAIEIAVAAHKGVRDKAGAPYILHPLRVMMRMKTDQEMIAAVLHDVVEDTDWTLKMLEEQGFSDEVVAAVDCLTVRKNESYEAFIDRLKNNAIARAVKIADIKDNMNLGRLKTINDKDIERLKKYHRALGVLQKSED